MKHVTEYVGNPEKTSPMKNIIISGFLLMGKTTNALEEIIAFETR